MRVANRLVNTAVCGLTICLLNYSLPSFGADVTTSPTPDGKEAKKVVETKPPEPRFKIYGWIEAGITGNPESPIRHHTFCDMFTHPANEPFLNEALTTTQGRVETKSTGVERGVPGSVR